MAHAYLWFGISFGAGLFNIYKGIYTLNSSGGKVDQRVILTIRVIHYYFSQQKWEDINIVFILQSNILSISTIFNSLPNGILLNS